MKYVVFSQNGRKQRRRSNDDVGVYDLAMELGCDEDMAEDIVAWSDEASDGEMYETEMEDLQIMIEDD